MRHVHTLPARSAVTGTWPDWVEADVRELLADQGITTPWPHQAQAASSAWNGHDTIISTGTASGKSLAYHLPILAEASRAATTDSAGGTTLYLSPTKALAVDQARALRELNSPHVVDAVVDGDTPYSHRQWAAAHAGVILTNPDLLHASLLPRHARWRSFLSRLRFIVIDEAHLYRGVFGSHVALVMRRLLRLATHYGANPTVIAASATTGDPAGSLRTLTGRDAVAISEDTSPHPGATVVLWEPPMIDEPEPHRLSALAETSKLLADLVSAGVRTLAFVPSRRGAEIVASEARGRLGAHPNAHRIAAYRAGYLREHRRDLEAKLRRGQLLGAATTNALELGIDITGLDAVIVCGYPGRLASFWQQIGRAGRGTDEALAIMVAKDDPLDTYLLAHPETVFERSMEVSVCDPSNPYVLAGHVCLAAIEKPLTEEELAGFDGWQPVVEQLCEDRLLRKRPGNRYYWVGRSEPVVGLRGGLDTIDIVETESGELIGTVDRSSADKIVHPGALYVHQGDTYLVDELDFDEHLALVHRAAPPWTTQVREDHSVAIVSVSDHAWFGPVSINLGTVDVTRQVTGYQRRRAGSGEVLGNYTLDMPPQHLRTVAVWWTVDDSALNGIDATIDAKRIAGALHAAEHASIGILPLLATCDRWDLGGLSTPDHPDTTLPTVFVYDGYPGGAGFAEQGFQRWRSWLHATLEAIADCPCPSGCPSCVVSPKCGNGNEPLDKAGAIQVLNILLRS
ncbi:DEAD/DEAH box helicase [Natronoglycomyces albus]|uniref:DEAD/DEAH box helicase n=1 Tax=Natronoglycomyces albus TaxID=2811108 RepID=A0A895XT04_9ACTN|nr:DEAD/DEAH box helicase [Natronoglycomyces albus]QSB04768.1 DEAD/DEAH box helicase [Natronoglycomyces albus]